MSFDGRRRPRRNTRAGLYEQFLTYAMDRYAPRRVVRPAARGRGSSYAAPSRRSMSTAPRTSTSASAPIGGRMYLQRLLEASCDLDTGGLFTYCVVVADNDRLESSAALVSALRRPVRRCRSTYCVEPRQNIALARNKAIEHATGDFVAFIDDDEFPTRRWLLHSVRGVHGGMRPTARSARSSRTSTTSRRSGSSTAASTRGRPTRPASSSTGARGAPATC